MSRGADRKICCAGLTRWLNATVPRRLRDSLRNVQRAATTARRDGNAAVVCQIIESAPD